MLTSSNTCVLRSLRMTTVLSGRAPERRMHAIPSLFTRALTEIWYAAPFDTVSRPRYDEAINQTPDAGSMNPGSDVALRAIADGV